MPFISSYDSRSRISSLGSGTGYSRTYTSSPMSSLTRKSSWERPSSLYNSSAASESYSKPSYSSSSTGNGTSDYSSSKYGSGAAAATPSWRTSLTSSDSNSSLPKYSNSRPVSTASTDSGERLSRFDSSRYDNGSSSSSRFENGNTSSSRFEAGKISSRFDNGTGASSNGTSSNRYENGNSSSSRFDNGNGTSRFDNGTGRGSWRDAFNKENDSNSTGTKFGSWRDKTEAPTQRYSSLNRESSRYSNYETNNNNNNDTTESKYGGIRKESESETPSKYSFESILAKYKQNNSSSEVNNGVSNNHGTSSSSSGTKLYQSNTFPRSDKTETSGSVSSSSSGVVVSSKPSMTLTTTTTTTSMSSNSAFNSNNLSKHSGYSDTSSLESSLPIVCRTSASSLTVTTPSYSRSNSNQSTAETSSHLTPSVYSRQVSNENKTSVGSNGHQSTLFSNNNDNSFTNSLERRSSKKYSAIQGYQSTTEKKIDRANDLAEKIEKTLAKHNVIPKDEPQPSWRQQQQQPRDESTNRGTRAESVDRSDKSKILQDRGTSPGLETDQASTSRIGKSSEIYSIRKTSYFKPNTIDIHTQTEQYYLKDRSKGEVDANFDLYDHVKKSFQYTSYTEKTDNPSKVNERLEMHKEKEQEDQKKYTIATAPMTNLMPGYQSKSSRDESAYQVDDNVISNNENNYLKPPETKAETESEWETDEDVIEAQPEEPKLEDALAKLDELDLDSDDDKRYSNYSTKVQEKEDIKIVVVDDDAPNSLENVKMPFGAVHYKQEVEVVEEAKEALEDDDAEEEEEYEEEEQKPTTFISEMMDIDDLLCKPSHFVTLDSPVAFEEEEEDVGSKTNSGDFSDNKPITDDYESDKKAPKKSTMLDDHPWWENGEQAPETTEDDKKDNDNKFNEAKEEDAEESEWESEYEEAEEEEEGEWEYYYDEEEAEDDDVKSTLDVATQKRTTSENEKDDKKEWIMKGLAQIIPMIPNRPKETLDNEEINDDEEEECKDDAEELRIQPMTEPEQKGYKDWLALASQDVIESEDLEIMSPVSEESPSMKEAIEELNEEQKKTRAKANKILDKLKSNEGAELKKVLFSLKTFFQEDKNLVADFITVGGLAQLVSLGKEDEVQLQNFILRALGQIMLYVDGMQGVMGHIQAIELLYKLISSDNKLVVKTAIKLLLVFIEYNESNYILLIDAVKNVASEEETTTWFNIVNVMSANDTVDVELCTYALTLVNKTLYEIDDQATFYDQSDFMEDLGIDKVTKLTSDDVPSSLLEEIQLYNVALKQEDGEQVTEDDISALYQDASLRLRTSLRTKAPTRSVYPRKSLRHKIQKLQNIEPDATGDIEGVSFKDLQRILEKNNLPTSQSGTALNEMALTGYLGKARDAFMVKLSRGETETPVPAASPEPDEREGETQWEKIMSSTTRALVICDIDFTDLQEEDKEEVKVNGDQGVPPAPPPPPACPAPPPPPPMGGIPPPPPPVAPAPPAMPTPPKNAIDMLNPISNYRKTKKTIKLFWKEVNENNRVIDKTIWDEMTPVSVDHKYLEYLFESRGRETMMKESNKIQIGPIKEIVVLDNKRSNFINIGMTKFPPPRIIKNAVMKMDSSIINKEGIEKLLTMLPSEEEVAKIEEAQEHNPELPLGTAEQFLITLSSISGLEARLRLWAFKIDFEDLEKEICEPMADLKQGLENLRKNATFKAILNVTLIIGNFLNNSSSKGFQIDYLAKVPEVKDTVHKHSLLYHLTFSVLESLPTASDLYSEIGPITRASRTDFEEVSTTLSRMTEECKNSWDYLRIIAKYDDNGESESCFRNKTSEFLTDAAERIIIMGKVHKRIMQRFHDFLLWLGVPKHLHNDYKAHQICKIISEFSLEFRTTRERVQQTIAKKKEAKERNKSRQKLHELMKMYGQSGQGKESKEVDDLSKMLRVEADGSIPRRKKKHRPREEGEHRRRRKEHHGEDGEEHSHRHRRHREKPTAEEVGDNSQLVDNDDTITSEVPVRRRRRPRPEPEATEAAPTEEALVAAAALEERMMRRRRKIAEDPNLTPEEAAMLLEKMDRRRRRKAVETDREEDRTAAVGAAEGTAEAAGEQLTEEEQLQKRAEARERRRRSQKSRSANISEQSVTLADGQRVAESEVDAGLFESLMGMGMGTLRRNKDRRRSTKSRESSKKNSGDLMRSRTRENNVYVEGEEE